MERDAKMHFDPSLWAEAQSLGLSKTLQGYDLGSEIRELASMLYGLALGSMDLPFCSSLAAHSVISMDLLVHFATPFQKEKYLPRMRHPDFISSICNSEDGAGTDLRKMKASAAVMESGEALVQFEKPCATNASHADLYLTSVWLESPNQRPSLGVLLLEKSEVSSWSLQEALSGFRTGLTGGVKVQNLTIPLRERLLNFSSGSLNIFKRCFDMERLFLGVMVAGILEGVESEIKETIQAKESQGFTYNDKQYLQEKLLNVYSVRTQIGALVDGILHEQTFDLNSFSKELSLLKILINQEAVGAVTNFYDFVGHRGFMKDHLSQKLLRDFMGLRYFGGTVELQKNNLYQELTRDVGLASRKKAG
jgi:alkylation response protein AidB-like acyl-CoA dehydrogenase